jgi:hypothetical protein
MCWCANLAFTDNWKNKTPLSHNRKYVSCVGVKAVYYIRVLVDGLCLTTSCRVTLLFQMWVESFLEHQRRSAVFDCSLLRCELQTPWVVGLHISYKISPQAMLNLVSLWCPITGVTHFLKVHVLASALTPNKAATWSCSHYALFPAPFAPLLYFAVQWPSALASQNNGTVVDRVLITNCIWSVKHGRIVLLMLFSGLKLERVCSSEMSIPAYKSTWRFRPEQYWHLHGRENRVLFLTWIWFYKARKMF